MVILSGGAVKMLFKHIAEKMKDVDAMVTVALQWGCTKQYTLPVPSYIDMTLCDGMPFGYLYKFVSIETIQRV